jgi:hypothetical protein
MELFNIVVVFVAVGTGWFLGAAHRTTTTTSTQQRRVKN